jgi:cytosine/adenosine deaminase-related metal-dependent hydrolase
MSSILLRGGTVLIHNQNDVVTPEKADVLIQGNKIAEIAPNISSEPDKTLIIDCNSKVISPGFIDTHRHLWQSQLRGRHANELLPEYMVTGNLASSLLTPADFYWGQLGGALESIDSGTTTVVDHSHATTSVEAAHAALAATLASGIRSFFCPAVTMRVKSWEPHLEILEETIPSWFMDLLQELGKKAPFANGRVELGLAYDRYFLPAKYTQELFKSAREAGCKLITSHLTHGPGEPSCILKLNELGLLDSNVLISHANQATDEESKLLHQAGAHVSSTPSTEMLMSLGYPVCFREDMQDISSLGIDCHSAVSADITGQMRLALQHERAVYNQPYVSKTTYPNGVNIKVAEVYGLATLKGARAIKREKELGSIAVGKLADLVIYDALSPAMVCAVEYDPVAAIVLHSSVRDVDTVIVDGIVRKTGGKLLPIINEDAKLTGFTDSTISWRDVASNLLRSYADIQAKAEKIDYKKAMTEMPW